MVDEILQYVLGALALACVGGAWVSRHKVALGIAAASAISAAVAAHTHAFWPMVSFALVAVWALVCAVDVMDLGWRVRAGFVTFVALLGGLCVWPTLHAVSGGKIPCPAYVQDNVGFRLVAGLDLRGGLRLVYTVEVEDAIRDKRDRYYDDMRQYLAGVFGLKASADKPATRDELAKLDEHVKFEKPKDNVAQINAVFASDADAARVDDAFLRRFSEVTRQSSGDPKRISFKIRTSVETTTRETAVNQARETIGRRIDELGLREAAVTVRDEDIVIEVPGEDEKTFKEIRDIISQTARLEFKILDDAADPFGPAARRAKDEELPKGLSFSGENPPIGPGKTGNVTVATITKQPGESMKEARQRLADWVAKQNIPDDHEVGYGVTYQPGAEPGTEVEKGWRTYYLFGKAEITGDMLRDAQAQNDSSQRGGAGQWAVSLTFTDAGGDRFEEITGANVKRRFAIILDGKVESAPVIQNKIGGGRAQITLGGSDPDTQLEEARKLELVLKSGSLPAPISPSNEQRIGPSLGRDSIEQGVKGAVGGSLLVLAFMLVYYHWAGAVADVAVLLNLMLQLAVLASFGASMTLPGIAGLALTIGIAVDANVLINERIREELREGKSPRAAVDAGYEKAFSAILDGHATTFIAGVILAQYGTGPIKGFAVTLIVGILASLFTGVVCTRLVFDWWVRGRRVKTLSVG